MNPPFDRHDRLILRDLAKEVAEIAAYPEIERRRQLWFEHNSLKSTHPMMLVFPEGAWEELLPASSMKCHHAKVREMEWELRSRIYTFRHFADDSVIEAEWVPNAVISDTGWGLDDDKRESDSARGAYRIEPVLKEYSDIKKLHYPELIFDEEATCRLVELAHDLFDGILAVRPKGMARIGYALMSQYIFLRGETNLLTDMIDAPGFIHEVMSYLVEGHQRYLQQLVAANLLSLNNDNTYHSSGGNGYTHELPQPGYDPHHVRPSDMWSSAESQELAPVSPKMHREFALEYEKCLLAPFGLNGYGCCEDLSKKLDDVFTIPHIRRISCSPFANVDICAQKLIGDYIFSWKPQPAHLVGEFDPGTIREYIQHTLEVTKENHCVLEMILKDTHTVEHYPDRMDIWTRIARDLIDKQ